MISHFFDAIFRSTDQDGQVETQTVVSTQLIFPTDAPNSGGSTSSNSNVAAIAGGVVGGALAILAIILIIFFILKRRRNTEDFDGDFDPDRLDPERFGGSATRPGALPNIDLVGAEVTPFTYQADPLPHKEGYNPYGQMVQQSGAPVVRGEGSGPGISDVHSSTTGSHYPTTVTGQSLSGMHHTDFRGPSPGPSLVTSGTHPSSKDRDAASERVRLQVANSGNGEGGSGQGTGIVLQHRDAGRLHSHVAPEEIPPSYDSVPHEVGFSHEPPSAILIV